MTVESSGVVNETGLAFVIFSGQTDLKWLKTLKPGFRHCFVLLETGGHWVVYNPLSNRTDITVIEGVSVLELMRIYRGLGYRIVPGRVRQVGKKTASWGLFTCVEAIKRVLGVHATMVITPFNLYNFLKN